MLFQSMSIPQVSYLIPKVQTCNLTSEVIRAARALLRWEQRNLAEASSISLPTIKRLEFEAGDVRGAYQDRGGTYARSGECWDRIHRRKRRRPRLATSQAPTTEKAKIAPRRGVTARTGVSRGSSAVSAAGAYRDLLCMGLFSNFFGLLGQQRPHFGRTKPNCSTKRAGRRLPDRIEDTTFCNPSRALTTPPCRE